MDRNPNIKVFFTYGAGISFEPKPHDLYYPDLQETITPPWTTRKVIRAMDHIESNYNYDFLVRTNLSTFFYFDGLLNRLSALPALRCISGISSILPGAKHVVGTGMILSRDIVRQIIRYSNRINIPYPRYIAEDKMISDFVVHTLGIDPIFDEEFTDTATYLRLEKINRFDREEIYRLIASPTNRNVYHFRIKNYINRAIDIPIMQTLKDLFYPSIESFNPWLYYRKTKFRG